MTFEKARTDNSSCLEVGSLWLNQVFPLIRDWSCIYQSLYLVESEVLRNRHINKCIIKHS